jgi:transcriptional regulator
MDDRHLSRELKRGSTELLILSLLEEQHRHGYDLARLVEQRSEGAIRLNAASLYPTLYRLEAEGFLEGRWIERAGTRRRRYYRITPSGRRRLATHRSAWEEFLVALNRVAHILPT